MGKCPIHKSDNVNIFSADGSNSNNPQLHTKGPKPAWTITEPMIKQMVAKTKQILKRSSKTT